MKEKNERKEMKQQQQQLCLQTTKAKRSSNGDEMGEAFGIV